MDCAEDSFAGLRKIRASNPDLIISDLRMPTMNGSSSVGRAHKISRAAGDRDVTGE